MNALEELVFVSLGRASMCWSEVPSGVFDSVEARAIGEELIKTIEKEKDETVRCLYAELARAKSELAKTRDKCVTYEQMFEACMPHLETVNGALQLVELLKEQLAAEKPLP